MTLTTPQGRPVIELHGDADAMAAQGTTLIHFGELMNECSKYTTAIGSDSAVGKGFSIAALQELALHSSTEIRVAGKRYCAQGSAVNIYAEAFDDAQSAIAKLVPSIEELDGRRKLLEEHIPELETFVPFVSNAECAHPELFQMPPLPQTLDKDEVKAFDDAIEAERTTRTTELAEVNSDLESDLAAYDRAFDTWEEATNAAIASMEKANAIWADSTPEKVYKYYTFAEKTIGIVSDMVDQISAMAAMTGVGLPLAAALQGGNTVLKALNVSLSLGKAIFPDSDVHRSAGQRDREGHAITSSLMRLIPFSGAAKFVTQTADNATGSAHELVDGWRNDRVNSWRKSTREHPYVPPGRRADGTPRTTTYKVPR